MGPGQRTSDAYPESPSDDRGAAALEFALVAPILFTVLFMIFSAGWGLWEYQAGRATTQEAVRLASVGIPSLPGYERNVLCLSEANGLRPGALTRIELSFHADATAAALTTTSDAVAGGFARVRLTYSSAMGDLPFAEWADGFTVQAMTRVEAVSEVRAAQTLTTTGETCS